MRRSFLGAIWCVIAIATVGHASVAIAQSGSAFRSAGRLFGPDIRGQVLYVEQIRDGRLFRLFRVDIENAEPLRTVPISVNGRLVAAIMTNPGGRARLNMRSAEFFSDPTQSKLMPANFPRLRTGDVVSAGSASSVMFDRQGGNGIPDPEDVQTVTTRGILNGTGADGVRGTVEFTTQLVRGEAVERVFVVELRDLQPEQDVVIAFNRRVIVTGTADADGNMFRLSRTPVFIIDPADGSPMPGAFPSMHAGDFLDIGSTRVRLVPVNAN